MLIVLGLLLSPARASVPEKHEFPREKPAGWSFSQEQARLQATLREVEENLRMAHQEDRRNYFEAVIKMLTREIAKREFEKWVN